MNHNPKKFLALLAAVFCFCSFSAFSKEKDTFKIRKNPFLLEFKNAKELTKNLSTMRCLRAWKITTEYFLSSEIEKK